MGPLEQHCSVCSMTAASCARFAAACAITLPSLPRRSFLSREEIKHILELAAPQVTDESQALSGRGSNWATLAQH